MSDNSKRDRGNRQFSALRAAIANGLLDVTEEWDYTTDVNILFVVDEEISTQPGADVVFSIGYVIELLDGMRLGSLDFKVDIAVRDGQAPQTFQTTAPFTANYLGFRFGTGILERYQQVWCFGMKPGNENGDEEDVQHPSAFPASDSELAALATWMNERQGGLFGTGDHHTLGASMCHRIPRLGTMRRWTHADGVPPQSSPKRIDTLRPPSAAYLHSNPGGPSLELITHEEDITAQPIQCVPWMNGFWPVNFRPRPHPVLCHPTLGPISVMPDHPHEGLCVENVPLDGTYDFDGSGGRLEYPDAIGGGPRPEPEIIAYGSTLGDPPVRFKKGPQPARPRFPMISVYDGHRAGVGRVATDSTWHHWFDMNIVGIKNANTREWQLIRRYYINLALWLNPPGVGVDQIYLGALKSHFDYPGYQEYRPSATRRELGMALKNYLASTYGPCWIQQVVFEELKRMGRLPMAPKAGHAPHFTFGGIDADVIEDAVFGCIVEQTAEAAAMVRKAKGEPIKMRLDPPRRLFARAAAEATDELGRQLHDHYSRLAELSRTLTG